MAWLFVSIFAIFGVTPAGADEFGTRYALVIGNSDYAHVEGLPNTARDAEAMADALESLRFTVFKGIDLTGDQFEALIEEFDEAATEADTVVFYYAGHGFQLNGLNYLAPVDAVLRDRSSIGAETLVINDIIDRIQRRNRQTIVFLDACRNNPLPPGARDGTGEGLAQVGTGDGTFVAFATQPGNVSYDGSGKNSPFTEALLTHIGKPGRSISSMMIEVRNEVSDRTLGRQVPWDQSSLRADFFFNPSAEYIATGRPTGSGIVIGAPADDVASIDPDAERPQADASDSDETAGPGTFITFGPAPAEDQVAAAPAAEPLTRMAAAPAADSVTRMAAAPATEETVAPVIENAASPAAKSATAPALAPDMPPAIATAPQRLKPDREWFPEDEETEAPAGERQMAALDPQQPLAPDEEELPREPLIDPRALARDVQSELARLGCYRLGIDGDWGPGSREGLRKYYQEKGEDPPSLEPSTELQAMLEAESGAVCPPPKASPPKQKRRVETPPPPKKAQKTRRAERQPTPAPAAPPAQRQAPAAAPSLPRLLQ